MRSTVILLLIMGNGAVRCVLFFLRCLPLLETRAGLLGRVWCSMCRSLASHS